MIFESSFGILKINLGGFGNKVVDSVPVSIRYMLDKRRFAKSFDIITIPVKKNIQQIIK